jgi:hypothetical protein
LDETLEYPINSGGVKVLKTDLREQTLNFLKELTGAANAPRTVVLVERLTGHHAAIPWPASSGEIPDEQPRFQIAY